jgi:hypothetical protein
MKRTVGIDARGNQLIVLSYSLTTAGFLRWNNWFVVVSADIDDRALGAAVLDGLSNASENMPLREEDRLAKPLAPVVEAVGLKTYAQYRKSLRGVGCRVR